MGVENAGRGLALFATLLSWKKGDMHKCLLENDWL